MAQSDFYNLSLAFAPLGNNRLATFDWIFCNLIYLNAVMVHFAFVVMDLLEYQAT